jgi:hypothetical protein
MFSMVRQLGPRALVLHEAIPLAAAMVIAELAYKFHSFTLEAVAFLTTWFVLSGIGSRIRGGR